MRGLFGALIGERKSTGSIRYGGLDDLWGALFSGGTSKSGVPVNHNTALQVSTVLACARRIAEAVSTVPVKLYRRDPRTGERSEARDHRLYDVLGSAPNDWQTSLEFRETLAFHTALTGNAFAFKNLVDGGKVAELIPIEPGCVTVRQSPDLSLSYEVRRGGNVETFPAELIWHVRGASWNGYLGMDAVKLAREAIGLALATEETHAAMHCNGVRPSGILSVEGNLDEAGLIRLAAYVKKNFGGLDNASRVMTLDRNAKFMPLAMTGVDAQHIETRRFQRELICEGMGVMPIMVGVAEKTATYASSEQMFLAHLVHTVRPWHERFGRSMDRHLLTRDERRDGYYFGFVEAAFLSPAMKDKAEFYKIALGGGGNPGWLTPDQVCAFEDLPKVKGGDRPYVPVNLTPIGDDGLPMPIARAPAPAPGAQNGTP